MTPIPIEQGEPKKPVTDKGDWQSCRGELSLSRRRVMEIKRQWAMPNSNTFSIKPIEQLIVRHIADTRARFASLGGAKFIDPFARDNKLADMTNDIDPATNADSHMDALDWIKTFSAESIAGVLFDPPYSPRQITECYKKLGRTVNMQTTQASFWSNIKQEVARVVKPGGVVITFGWNSGGIGKTLGFDIVEILLVPHGGWHNDTIVTVECKLRHDDPTGME